MPIVPILRPKQVVKTFRVFAKSPDLAGESVSSSSDRTRKEG
jgi:hypothetical protein